jgi:hypothetical protein
MALDTYTGLLAHVALQLNRSDLTSVIPDFVTLTEAELKRRLRASVRRDTLDISAQVTSLPCDAKELRSIYPVTGSPSADRPLLVSTPEEVARWRARQGGVSGRPVIAAITSGGRELIVAPAPDETYTMEIIFFPELQPLVATTNEVNDELREAPDMYLAGVMAYAEDFLEHDEAALKWRGRFEAAIEALNTQRENAEYGASLRPAGLPVVLG